MNPARRTLLPTRISGLQDLASNLWWSWNPTAREVFRWLDYPLWQRTDHNPLKLLGAIAPERFEEAATNPLFLELYDRALDKLSRTRTGHGTWWAQNKHH